jgi:hypothetical protein
MSKWAMDVVVDRRNVCFYSRGALLFARFFRAPMPFQASVYLPVKILSPAIFLKNMLRGFQRQKGISQFTRETHRFDSIR